MSYDDGNVIEYYDDYGNPVYATSSAQDKSSAGYAFCSLLCHCCMHFHARVLFRPGGEKLTNKELLELGLDQLLHPDFVVKQTRGSYGAKKKDDEGEEKSAGAGVKEGEEVGDEDASKLVATVLQVLLLCCLGWLICNELEQESRVEHLTAGFVKAKPTGDDKQHAQADVTERLARELAGVCSLSVVLCECLFDCCAQRKP